MPELPSHETPQANLQRMQQERRKEDQELADARRMDDREHQMRMRLDERELTERRRLADREFAALVRVQDREFAEQRRQEEREERAEQARASNLRTALSAAALLLGPGHKTADLLPITEEIVAWLDDGDRSLRYYRERTGHEKRH